MCEIGPNNGRGADLPNNTRGIPDPAFLSTQIITDTWAGYTTPATPSTTTRTPAQISAGKGIGPLTENQLRALNSSLRAYFTVVGAAGTYTGSVLTGGLSTYLGESVLFVDYNDLVGPYPRLRQFVFRAIVVRDNVTGLGWLLPTQNFVSAFEEQTGSIGSTFTWPGNSAYAPTPAATFLGKNLPGYSDAFGTPDYAVTPTLHRLTNP